jgi:hypothetical protein
LGGGGKNCEFLGWEVKILRELGMGRQNFEENKECDLKIVSFWGQEVKIVREMEAKQ